MVKDTHDNVVAARSLADSGCPVEEAAGRIEGGPAGCGKKFVGQIVGRHVRVGGAIGQGDAAQFVVGADAVVEVGHHRGAVHFADDDGEGLRRAQAGRAAVSDFNGDHVVCLLYTSDAADE